MSGVQKNSAEHRDAEDAGEYADQPNVQLHVAVQNMAELVRNNALQLVATEKLHAAASHADCRGVHRRAGGERVDALLIRQHIHRGNGDARGDGHFLDYIQQLPLVRVRRRRV